MIDLDTAAYRAFDESRIARTIERGARVFGNAAAQSRAVATGRAWWSAVRGYPGVVLVAGAATHVLLTAAIAPPAYWQWLILPSIALAAGAVLMSRQKS
jgi:hypothetical protein